MLRRDEHVLLQCKANEAKVILASATNRLMRAENAVAIGELLETLIGADELYCKSLEMACRLREARVRGNQVDLWRIVGEIEAMAEERGA